MKKYLAYPVVLALLTLGIEFIVHFILMLLGLEKTNSFVFIIILGGVMGMLFVDVRQRIMTISEKLQVVILYSAITTAMAIWAGALSDIGEDADSSLFWVIVAGAFVLFMAAHYAALSYGCGLRMKNLQKNQDTQNPDTTTQ